MRVISTFLVFIPVMAFMMLIIDKKYYKWLYILIFGFLSIYLWNYGTVYNTILSYLPAILLTVLTVLILITKQKEKV
jgi:hypothetical protein